MISRWYNKAAILTLSFETTRMEVIKHKSSMFRKTNSYVDNGKCIYLLKCNCHANSFLHVY